jgi:Kef-type K+ transport system membrane component KefB
MLRNLSELFLAATLLVYVVPYFIWKLLRTDNFIPLPIIQIMSGLLLGPAVLGKLHPEFFNYIFSKDNINVLSGVAWLGIIFFVWSAGVHLDIKAAFTNKKDTFTTASLALTGPLVFGSIFAYVIYDRGPWAGEQAATWQFVLAIGMGMAVTALPILVLLMEKLGIFNGPIGRRVLTYASLDDIFIWIVLGIIIMDWDRSLRQLIFLPIFALAAYGLNVLVKTLKNKQDIWYLTLVWTIAVALAADWSGLHYIVGGFMAGAVMKKEWFEEQELENFKTTVLVLMMPIYFLLTGLRTSWELSGVTVLILAFALFAVQFAGKTAGVFVASKVLGWPKGEWKLMGTLLQTKALIEIIFATILMDKGIITSEMFTALLLMAVMSTMVTIPIAKKLLKS